MVDWISPLLGIRFSLSKEELQIYRPDDKQFLSYIEISQQAEEAEQQLEETEQQLEQERERTKTMEDLLNQYRDRFGELQ